MIATKITRTEAKMILKLRIFLPIKSFLRLMCVKLIRKTRMRSQTFLRKRLRAHQSTGHCDVHWRAGFQAIANIMDLEGRCLRRPGSSNHSAKPAFFSSSQVSIPMAAIDPRSQIKSPVPQTSIDSSKLSFDDKYLRHWQ
jgi:hypothetical protein